MVETYLGKVGWPFFNRIGTYLKHSNPTMITALGFIIGISSGISIAFNYSTTGIILLWISGFCDVMDGTIARLSGKVSSLGSYFDLIADRMVESALMVSSIHVSNAIGTHVDIATINKAARSVGAYFLIDAAQSVPHQKIDVKKLDADFLVFSGHKLLGPTGIGILYIKKEVQERIPPYQFGGGMVFHADYHTATWLKPPHCYEAGTPPIAQVIGLGAALSYIKKNIDYEKLKIHEASLCSHAITELQKIPGITLLGPLEQLKQKGHLLSFTVQGFHPHDVGAFLDHHAITVRSGHYCAQPLAQKLGIDGSIRISFYAYNSREEVDHFIDVMKKLVNKKS
jgi:cysteine desulfurase / selenocysteine lyase